MLGVGSVKTSSKDIPGRELGKDSETEASVTVLGGPP